jgi:hypothetical protein
MMPLPKRCLLLTVLVQTASLSVAFSTPKLLASPHAHRTLSVTSTVKIATSLYSQKPSSGDESVENNTDNEETLKQDNMSLLDQLNAALDSPILDANNKADQGFVAEALKLFVRGQPEVASITFSIVVIGMLVGLVRLVNWFVYYRV